MKVIIAGSRHGCKNSDLLDAISSCGFEITEIITGGAPGVDTQAHELAMYSGYDETIMPANWISRGKPAGPHRNRRMAAYADALIAMPGGKGTADMINAAREYNLPVYVYTIGQLTLL